MYFLAPFIVLLSIITHAVDRFHQPFLNSFSELFLFCFWRQFLAFLVTYLLILHSLYYIQLFKCSYNTFAVPLLNSNTVFFYCSGIVYSLIFLPLSPPTSPSNTICWIALVTASKPCLCLDQLQLVCNYLWSTHNLTNNLLYNHHHALLILFWLHHTSLSSH